MVCTGCQAVNRDLVNLTCSEKSACNKRMPRRPNIVFVLTDDQGYGDLGCHGNRALNTPNLDAFHADAVRFTDFHVGTTCAPSRAGLLTGHYCNSAGVWHTIGGRSLLRPNEWTLADALSGAGYQTGHFGKWHLGDSQPFRPHERGFTEAIYHAGGGIGNTGDHWGNDYFDDTYFVNGVPTNFQGYCTDVFFREAMRFITEHRDEPFFCYIAPNAPHGPWNVEPEYSEMYRGLTDNDSRERFYGMITNIDENFGKLTRHLEELGLSEDTILVFMTDNGTAIGVDLDESQFPIEGLGSYNAGMRGLKGSPYEGGHRVPFFLRFPAEGLQGGQDVSQLTSYVDFMPTILDLCRIDVPEERTFHGMSLLPIVRNDLQKAAAFDQRVIVADTQRIARPMKWRNSCAMSSTWRLVQGKELYDVREDPSQRWDVSEAHPELVQRLRAGYDAWWETVSDQFDLDVAIAVGSSEEPVKITTHDIRNEASDTAWNQRHVRQAYVCSGYWPVDVCRTGRYRVELRRWPVEADHSITAGIDGDDVEWRKDAIEERFHTMYTGGKALPVEWARLELGGRVYHVEVADTDDAATFEVSLESGTDRLYASFFGRDERSIAPYYVYVTLLGNS